MQQKYFNLFQYGSFLQANSTFQPVRPEHKLTTKALQLKIHMIKHKCMRSHTILTNKPNKCTSSHFFLSRQTFARIQMTFKQTMTIIFFVLLCFFKLVLLGTQANNLKQYIHCLQMKNTEIWMNHVYANEKRSHIQFNSVLLQFIFSIYFLIFPILFHKFPVKTKKREKKKKLQISFSQKVHSTLTFRRQKKPNKTTKKTTTHQQYASDTEIQLS